jgi:hypothetical protein
MNAYEKVMNELGKIKSMFENATEEKVEITFETATLLDGETTIEFEMLEAGQQVFIVTDEGRIPAPEGTHALGGEYTGVVITVDADGFITEVVDERGSEETTTEETSAEFEAVSADILPEVLEGVTEIIASELGLEMGQAYDLASAVITKINEMTSTEQAPVEQSMSAEAVESIINGKLESITTTFEAVADMMKSISEESSTLRNEIATLKADFESFKAMPSVETKEGEKFARVGNLTTKQQFLKNYKNL